MRNVTPYGIFGVIVATSHLNGATLPPVVVRFDARLFRVPGKGGWTFAPVPERFAPSAAHAWGRTPVVATVDGHQWKTSVWRERSGRTLLPVPKAARGTKEHGDTVSVRLEFHV